MFRFIILMLISVNAFSAGWATKDWSGNIEYINVENGFVRVHFSADDSSNPDDCGTAGFAILEKSNGMFDAHYSLLMSAMMANKPVKLYVSGCRTAWTSSFPKLTSIYVKK